MKDVRDGSTQKKYIIRRAIDEYRPGDEFVPTGAKNDKLIIEHYCNIVYNEKKEVKKQAKARTGGK